VEVDFLVLKSVSVVRFVAEFRMELKMENGTL